LSKDDKQIAVSRIAWRMKYADIAAVVNMDRTTASDHFKYLIVPEIRRWRDVVIPPVDTQKAI
jgi:hypothetical protein